MLLTLGVTGGIGSGKSVVSHLLRMRGVAVYDTDIEAKRIMATDATVRMGMIDLFGDCIYTKDGAVLDHQQLASIIFGNDQALAQVNALVHPIVGRDFCAWRNRISSLGDKLCALESALLYEAGLDKICTAVVAVVADKDVRLQRAIRRDGSNALAIESRMQVQFTDAELMQRASFVLRNESPHLILPQLDGILLKLSESFT